MTRCLSWLSQYRMFFAPFLRDQVGQSPPRRTSDTVDLSLQEEEEPRMVPLSSFSAGLFAICSSPIIHLVCPPQCCIRMVFNFAWDDCNTQEKLKPKVMQNLEGCAKDWVGLFRPALWEYLKRRGKNTSLIG